MKSKGNNHYIGVRLGDIKKFFSDDAVIHVSKKWLLGYDIIAGISEEPKSISLNVTDNTEKTEIKPEPKPEIVEPVLETSPPVEINVNDGDW
tara:strand:+ start:218 stop:493 length:276 start_codon:yes stop_codon:yes gene_type:complete